MRRSLACLAAATLLAAGCGGDDEKASDPGTVSTEAPTETAGVKTETAPTETAKTETAQTETNAENAPEEQPGGAGDEEAIRTEVVLSGRGGRIAPARVRVPAYIGVRVELRSEDGRTYALKVGKRTIRAGGSVSSASTTIDGMRPGERVVAEPLGEGNRVVIEASAEPGP